MTLVAMPRGKKVSQKHGVESPSTVNDACEIDDKIYNTFWRDVIDKEMITIGAAFEILEDG